MQPCPSCAVMSGAVRQVQAQEPQGEAAAEGEEGVAEGPAQAPQAAAPCETPGACAPVWARARGRGAGAP
jgi:hypothetical protein